MKKILVVDDDVDICTLLSRYLTKKGFEVATSYTGTQALEVLKKNRFDLVLCDFRLGDIEGSEVLVKIKELYPEVPVIIITGYSDIKVAVNVMKLGAFDYVTKPLLPDEILFTINKALDGEGAEIPSAAIPVRRTSQASASHPLNDFVTGESPQSRELYKQIDLVAPTNYCVIIFGETGTGKESVAHAIHNKSNRRDKPFIAMDCGALSKELAGSELFGHEKGAFTGAIMSKAGHFELANGGTLFLDEVANLSYEIQVSLLRVLQERKAKRIGSNKEIDLDVRIIVASNENLYDAVQKGRFREDLYHRFNEFSIHIPPLRERGKDIMIFANHFLSIANKELGKSITSFSEEVVSSFLNYQWPGNLRELKNVIKRAALLTDGDTIVTKALPMEISTVKYAFPDIHPRMTGIGNTPVATVPNLKSISLEAEYEMIMSVLKQVNFNRTKAAKILNIDRKTLYNKMKALNI
jgi:two-component system, NtrC family, response regulator HydG